MTANSNVSKDKFIILKLNWSLTRVGVFQVLVPLEKGDVVQDSSTLELHKAQYVVYAQVQLGNDKPGNFKKVNRQWLEEVFGDSPDSKLVDDFLQKATTRHIGVTLEGATHMTHCQVTCFRLR